MGTTRNRSRGDKGAENDGEISLSIEETNKLRASLGLPPLKINADPSTTTDTKKRKQPSDINDNEEPSPEDAEAYAAKVKDLESRIQESRQRRRQQSDLANTKTLGAAADDVDDVMAWVNKSRTIETTVATKKKARKGTAAKKQNDDIDDDDDTNNNVLAGAKVKHVLADLHEGEEMILTLEDKQILDEQGRLNEDDDTDDITLENVQKREDVMRAKAFRAADKKAKPLWEEDGIRRSILDKYDEEEEEALRLDDADAMAAAKQKAQHDVRAKLAAMQSDSSNGNNMNTLATSIGGGDYYTKEEMDAMRKPKKKKERHLKKKALTAEDLAELEKNAEAEGKKDLGSRADRERRQAEKAAELAAGVAEKRARFDAALQKANYTSRALRSDNTNNDDDDGIGDDEEDDLQKSLQRARELALKKKKDGSTDNEKGDSSSLLLAPEALAEQIARRRGQHQGNNTNTNSSGGLLMSDIAEFTRNISVKAAAAAAAASTGAVSFDDVPTVMHHNVKKEEEGDGGDDDKMIVKKEDDDDDGGGDGMDVDDDTNKTKRKYRTYKTEHDNNDTDAMNDDNDNKNTTTNDTVLGEKIIGQGLAGALAFLKERGELHSTVEWAGRTNDSKNSYFTNAMGNYSDVYTGGRTDDRLALDIEVALTKKDEYGRILTPKEAFRQFSQQFHGVKPSKNSMEKRAKQIAKELAQRKMATSGSQDAGAVAGLKVVQEKAATPFMVLEGTIKPGQSRNALYSGIGGDDGGSGGGSSINKKDNKKGGVVNNKSARMFPPPPPRRKQ